MADLYQDEERSSLRSETANDSSKRKLEEDIQLAKQKAQEIAARLVSDAESKRPRLDDPSQPSLFSNSVSHPPFSGNAQNFPSQPIANSQVGSVSFAAQPGQYHGFQGASKKIKIPNGKVGVVIGKGGETIKYFQLQSGAKIQITKDSEADRFSQTRDVELMGTAEQISRAEQLINDVIAESDAGGSAPSANRGFNSMQPGAEQFTMKVPNNKVALLIGKLGENIKNMQSRSGARIQIIPLHLPPGDTSTERTVYINGSKEQIETAKELINEVISENRLRNPSGPSSYMQQPGYQPSGNWGPPGQPPMTQQPGYGYTQPGTHLMPPPYYGHYPTQQASWDQSNPSAAPPPPQQSTAYYEQESQTGSAPPNLSYSYSQTPPIPSQSYDQGYSQQPPSYGQDISSQAPPLDQQKPYATPGHGPSAAPSQPDGTTPTQSTQVSPAYPLGYSQSVATPQAGFMTSLSYMGPPPAQPGYDQTGFSQMDYGGQQPVHLPPLASQAVYAQGGYPPQPAPAPANCVQGTNPPVYAQPELQPQPQSQPTTNGFPQPLVYGAENTGNGNSAPGNGSAPIM